MNHSAAQSNYHACEMHQRGEHPVNLIGHDWVRRTCLLVADVTQRAEIDRARTWKYG